METVLLRKANCRILIAEIPENWDQLIPQLANFNDYTDEFKQINAVKRKKEFISVRILMNILLRTTVRIKYDSDHKPYLSQHEPTTSISVSHSGNFYAVAASLKGVVGIDIEARTNRVVKVRKRYLDEEELTFLYPDESTGGLEIAWSAKEALFKCIGKDAYNFHTMKIQPFKQGKEGMLTALFTPTGKEYTLHFHQTDTYTLVYSI